MLHNSCRTIFSKFSIQIYKISKREPVDKILISLPNQLALRLKAVIPQQQSNKVLSPLIEQEIQKREKRLYYRALVKKTSKSFIIRYNCFSVY